MIVDLFQVDGLKLRAHELLEHLHIETFVEIFNSAVIVSNVEPLCA